MTWIDTHASDTEHRRVILLDWLIGSTHYRWAAYDVPVVTTGSAGAPSDTWNPRGFSVDGISTRQGEAAGSARVLFGNANGGLNPLVWSAANTRVTVYEAWLNTTGKTTIPEQEVTLFAGVVNSWELTPETLTLFLTALNPFSAILIPRRMITSTCSVQFKGPACGYAGAETDCNRTLARCQALSNDARFGGCARLDPRS